MEFWLIQLIGLTGNLIVIASMQFNNRKIVLCAQSIACVLWVIHYGYLGAMTAVFTNFISFARSVVFYNNDKRWAKSNIWLAIFIALFILNSILTWDGPRSILPGIAMSMTTWALWAKKMRVTRILHLIQSPFWLSYDIITMSYSCALIEAIAFVSYIVAIFRYDIYKRRKTTPKKELSEDKAENI